MFNIEEIKQKWQELGFLEQITENLKPLVALKFERLTICILDNDDYIHNRTLTNIVFPIVHRIYKEGGSIGEVKNFIIQLDDWFIENRQIVSDLNLTNNIDGESHLCSLFVEQYKSENIIKPIRWVNKHKFVKNEKPNNEEVREPMSEPTDDTVINWWDRLKHFFCNLIKK